MKMNKGRIILLLILMLLIGGAAGSYAGMKWAYAKYQDEGLSQLVSEEDSASDQGNPSRSMAKINQAYKLIKKNYVEDVSEKKLTEGAIQGMLESLKDPYSTYMDAETMKQFNEQIEASFEGIGAEVSMEDGKVTIVAPIKGSPAEKAGLRPKDQILKIDGKSIAGLDLNEAVEKIRGKKGSKVKIEIKRPGAGDTFDKEITRDEIPVETVESSMKTVDGKKTGVIKLTSFSEHTAEDFNKQLKKLEDDGMQGLVIDVRGNPGGLLNSVEDILGNFIPKSMPFLQVEDRNGKKEPHYSDLKAKKKYPISVLIDEGSASASEILAVALKEAGYDAVGTTSFGKGTVQQAVPLGDGSTVKLTFYKWLSPKGNWIHKKGIKPTIKQKQPAYYYANPIQVKKTLTVDHTGDNIRNLQVMLNGLGFEPGRTDGYFSKETETAIKAFQKKNNLTVTGKADKETAEKIEAKVIEKIRGGKDDEQLQKALDTLF